MASRFLREIPEDGVVRKGGYISPSNSIARTYTTFSYANAQEILEAKHKKSEIASHSAAAKPSYLELHKGDMVNHTAFGRGMVLSVLSMGSDALLEIAFDQIGTKKLMAKTASAHMKKL